MVGSSVHGQPKEMLQITGLRRTKTSVIAAWVAAVLAIRGALMLYLGSMVVDLGMLMLVHLFFEELGRVGTLAPTCLRTCVQTDCPLTACGVPVAAHVN